MPRKNILINKDAELQKVLEGSFFRRIGFQLLVAEDVEQAYEMVEEMDPVLVLLALGDPGWDDESFCRQIKEDALFRSTPIILIPPPAQIETAARCRAAGCDALLSRPIDGQKLLTAACRLLIIAERAEARLPVRLPAQLGRDSRKMRPGRILNINTGGLFVETDRLHPVGTRLSLEFSLPGGAFPLRCYGVVAWVNHPEWVKTSALPSGMGVRFVELAEGEAASLAACIAAAEVGEIAGGSLPEDLARHVTLRE